MPDLDFESLNLGRDFPPVPTEAWEAAIAEDLHGADYDKKLVWRSEEGLAIRPYYRKEALAGLEGQLHRPHGVRRDWEISEHAEAAPNAIRVEWLHESGAHAVQELGYGIAAGVERFAELGGAVEFLFAVGPNYFIEIAKLRAVRLMWSQVADAFGASESGMRLHVLTPRRNKSVYDRYTNLLRVTTEAMAAVLGGCDRLTVEPFGFDPHLAENVQRLLKEESHLDAVADAAAGSYYIEALTDSLARAGWALLQKVEAGGGYSKALASGSIDKALAETRAARAKAYSSRRRALVGVNNYPDLAEKPPGADFDGDQRIAAPFEAIRRRTTAHAESTGRYPKVLLLTRGDAKMKGARANFCLNFFGCGGFDVIESAEYQGTDADLIVLCSSDAEYPAFAREVCASVKAPVLVAGNPKVAIEGIQGLVHVGSDLVDTLTEWQDKLGIGRVQ